MRDDSGSDTTSGEDYEVLGGEEQEEMMDFETFHQTELEDLVVDTNPADWYLYNSAALPETTREQDKASHVAVGEEEDIDPSAASLIEWRRRWQITKGAMEDLLQRMTRISFRLRGIPKSVYLLDRLEDIGFACPPRYSFEDKSSGQRIYFCDLLEIAVMMLSNQWLRAQMIFKYKESNKISHPCHSQGWKEYEGYKKIMEAKTGLSLTLLNVLIYVDEFEQQRSRKEKVVYLCFS
jgi:hypothetical protein